jgi:N-acylneuraminate cytidylyltransferase
LQNHPLIAYTIAAAAQSGVFRRVIVSTESEEIADIARAYGAEIPFLRPTEYAGDLSPDIEWVTYTLKKLKDQGDPCEIFSLLRPTSPFRQAATIQRAFEAFIRDGAADSLRAVEKCSEHPAKMWRLNGNRMTPVMKNPEESATPWHSSPYQALPEIYVQNASLEIARVAAPLAGRGIAGDQILPFITEGHEGFDINRPEDWVVAEYLLDCGQARLPELDASARAP